MQQRLATAWIFLLLLFVIFLATNAWTNHPSNLLVQVVWKYLKLSDVEVAAKLEAVFQHNADYHDSSNGSDDGDGIDLVCLMFLMTE